MEERIVVAQVLHKQSADGGEVVFEDWGQILAGKVVEQLDAEVERGEVLSKELLIVLVCGDLLIGALRRVSVYHYQTRLAESSYLQQGQVGLAEL